MNLRAAVNELRVSATTGDLIVSFPGKQFSRARREIVALLRQFGDADPFVKKTSVWGIAVAHTGLNNREVIQHCRALWRSDPQRFRFAIKWLPVDYWSATNLTDLRELVRSEIAPRIGEHQTWAMRVQKRRWQLFATTEIVRDLAVAIPRKVDLEDPDWIVWIDVVGRVTAVSLLRPEEIFAPLAKHEASLLAEGV